MNSTSVTIGDAFEVVNHRIAKAAMLAGWRVFPLDDDKPKKPAIKGWMDKATTSESDAALWWAGRFHSARVGIATGAESNLWVLDLDRKSGEDGVAELARLEAEHGPLPDTFTVATPHNGLQLYWRWPPDGRVIGTKTGVAPGIDTRGWRGLVVAPSTVMDDGTYTVVKDLPTTYAPAWLVELAAKRENDSSVMPDADLDGEFRTADDWLSGAETDLNGFGSQDDHLYRALCSAHARSLGKPGMQEFALQLREAHMRQARFRPDDPYPMSFYLEKVDYVMGKYAPGASIPVWMSEAAGGLTTDPEPRAVVGQAVGREALDEAHRVFRKWLGNEYDLDALNATLAAAAVERLDGDPLWLLVISGSGNAKTETVQALGGAGALVTSTIASEGALLSGTAKKAQAKDATGGLLRKLGSRGVLVIKDMTSILSMDRIARAKVLGAVRELYDGRWERNLGEDGGKTLTWAGRLAVIGAVTTVWDRAHDVIAAMGDRFVLLRVDSFEGRLAAGRQAIGNIGSEVEMRAELSEVVGKVIAGVDGLAEYEVTPDEMDRLLAVADLVTLARTAVERDHQGRVIDAHAPEMPTRFAKQLAQVLRGGLAIGLSRPESMTLALRCGRDSLSPLRLAIMQDVAEHPVSTTKQIGVRLDKPKTTVDRELQGLQLLRILTLVRTPSTTPTGGQHDTWQWMLAPGVDPSILSPSAGVQKSSSQSLAL